MAMSTGIAMEVHYCMGKRAGVDFYNSQDEQCSRCGMKEKKGGCCSDTHLFYKISDAHKIISNDYSFSIVPAIVTTLPELNPVILPNQTIKGLAIQQAPPDVGPPIYISNRVFRL